MEEITKARNLVANARAIIITAGAGMGVDSGLPDFRGNDGFWKAYPPIAKLNLKFEEISSSHWFERNPKLAWGFFGHRLNLYRKTIPHRGFELLRNLPQPKFVFTSNIDGQFQKAGFLPEQIVECHGSIHHIQCLDYCLHGIQSAENIQVNVDEETMTTTDLPKCACGKLARPNVLMFSDGAWNMDRTLNQEIMLDEFLSEHRVNNRLDGVLVIEIGGGTALPTVRRYSEKYLSYGADLIRINVRESQVPQRAVGIPLGGLEALERILI